MRQPTTDLEATLLQQLRHVGPLQDEMVAIPGTGTTVRVKRPQSIDQLLEQAESDPEQNLPYWSELWPSGIALASLLLDRPELVRGQRVIELGSGLGITAAIAISLGADLIATDYSPKSLLLTRLTCLMHGTPDPEIARVNWRDASDPFLNGSQTFPVILAADVLYERRDITPLLALFDRLLDPQGTALLAEPGREPARLFLEQVDAEGWNRRVSQHEGPWPDPKDEAVVVRIHELTRGSDVIRP